MMMQEKRGGGSKKTTFFSNLPTVQRSKNWRFLLAKDIRRTPWNSVELD
jgi:hypothetical protein